MEHSAPRQLRIDDYSYQLPPEKIAAYPLPQRDASKLLRYHNGQISNHTFSHLPALLPAGATLVFNDTRVIEARLLFQKPSGGVIEIFCLEPWQQSIEEAVQQKSKATWQCLIGGASKWKPGQVLQAVHNDLTLTAHYVAKHEDGFLVRFEWTPADLYFVEVLHTFGAIPLPPYIKRKAEGLDWERYQTVFSRHEGSVAAPTAALHFTPAVFEALQQKGIGTSYITLHVGAGTFRPVKTETIGEHHMHGEPFVVKRAVLAQLQSSKEIVAVGTTSLRTLESLYWLGVKFKTQPGGASELGQWEAYELAALAEGISYPESFAALLQWLDANGLDTLHCRTHMIIAPGYRFRVVKGLVTNFHQPQSTLLLLIAAFVGADWRRIYDHALANDYRFLSYGDSSYLTPSAATQW